MSTTTDRTLPAATALFRRWRSTRERGERIPPALWAAACAAAREHGVSRTSQELGLDYYSLKRRVDEAPRPLRVDAGPGPVRPVAARQAFVELPVLAVAAPASAGVACTIVLEQARGESTTARMRIELPAITTPELAALVERWGHRS